MTHLLIIMTDQQRMDSLGCYGNTHAKTPNLDRLAARGAVFTNHFTPNQICSPSRASLFSGLYPRHHGLTHNGIPLDAKIDLITHQLKQAGYATHGIGKFHFQPILAPAEYAMPDAYSFWETEASEGWRGPFYGFDTVDMLIGESAAVMGGGHYPQWLQQQQPDAGDHYAPEAAQHTIAEDLDELWKCAIDESLHYNRWIANRACDYLKQRPSDQPSFLFVSFPDPHHPFSPPAPWCDLFDQQQLPMPVDVPGELDKMPDYIRRNQISEQVPTDGEKSYLDFLLHPGIPREQGFMQTTHHLSDTTIQQMVRHTYGSISMIDDCVGQIIQTLEAEGILDETLIVFTSDHGELLGDHGLLRKGAAPYQQVLQTPMIIAGPKVVAGERSGLTSHIDLKATLLEHLGLPVSGDDGTSFAPALQQLDGDTNPYLFAEYHPRAVADQYNQTLLTPEWRLTTYTRRPDWGELFDRVNDPFEHHNRYFDPDYAEIRQVLTHQLTTQWPSDMGAGDAAIATY